MRKWKYSMIPPLGKNNVFYHFFQIFLSEYTNTCMTGKKKMLFKPPHPHCLLRKKSPDNWRDLCLLCEFQLRKCKLEEAGTLWRDWETLEKVPTSLVWLVWLVWLTWLLRVCSEWLVYGQMLRWETGKERHVWWNFLLFFKVWWVVRVRLWLSISLLKALVN